MASQHTSPPPPDNASRSDASSRTAAWFHDLRAALATVHALTDALEDKLAEPSGPSEHRRLLQLLGERLLWFAADGPDSSASSDAAVADRPSSVSLAAVADKAVAVAAVAARARGVSLSLMVDDNAVLVDVAEPAVARALDNLLANAVGCSGRGATVGVVVSSATDCGIVAVIDSCGGIAEDEIDHVFDHGFQGSHADGGEGIGLWSAGRLIVEQRGAIEVANTEDGCRFEVRLPLWQAADGTT